MCIAVGNVSFEDCDMFTSSFGCSSFFPAMLVAAVGDDLVDVHVRLRAGAGLPHNEREVPVELPGEDLVAARAKWQRTFLRSCARGTQRAVCLRRRLFQYGKGAE